MKRRTWIKAIGLNNALMIAPLMVPMLGACGNKNSDSLKWTEDVKLPDGRIVTLTRYQEFKGPHEVGDTPTESDYWFEFKHPDTGELIRWNGKRNLNALALFVHNGDAYLVTTPWYGDSGFYFNSPNPPYLLYIYKGGWKGVDLYHIPVKLIRVNMTFSPKEKREIISRRAKITSEETSNSYYKGRPYLINFDRMKKQTFGNESIGHYDDLVD